MDSVCVRLGFTRNGFSVSGFVLLEIDSVCVRYSFTRNRFSVLGLVLLQCVSGLVFTRARKRAG